MTRAETILKQIRENPQSVSWLNGALQNLILSRILEFLRARHIPQILGLGKDAQVLATQCAFTCGYNQALNDLEEFREKYLEEQESGAVRAQMDFGATDTLLAEGFISKEEADALRRNEPPKPPGVTVGKPPTSKPH